MCGQNKLFILFFVVFVLLLTGCSLKPVELIEIGNVEVQNVNNNVITIKVTATINNPNSRLTLKNSVMDVYLKDKELGKITQLEKIIIDGKSTKKYTSLFKVELTNLKGGIFSALSMFSGKKPELKLTGKIKVSSMLYWKTLTIKDYPIKF